LLVGLFCLVGYLKKLLAIGWCQGTLNFKEMEWELSMSAAANPIGVCNLVSGQLSNGVVGSKLRNAGGWIEKKYY
jgi:hypothetical protein